MAPKILCLSAILLEATVGACWPIADKNAVAGAQSAERRAQRRLLLTWELPMWRWKLPLTGFLLGIRGAGPSALLRAIRIPTAVPRLCRFKVG